MNKLFTIVLMITTLLFVFCSNDSDNGVNPNNSQPDIPDTAQTDIPESSHEVVGVWSSGINKQFLTSFGLAYDSVTVVATVGKQYDFALEVISNNESLFLNQGTWSLSPKEDTLFLEGNDSVDFRLPIDIENNTWSISLSNLLEIAPAIGIDPTANPLLITLANNLSLTFTKQK
ncbi:MAG: hypothetical protein Q4F84_00015 [Fibrobacter sp.]|nr:hypothetical protein [Fibrobacter sp.]